MIFPDNIVSLLDKYGVPKDVDYISVDVDSFDIWVLDAILESGRYRPRVISIEYNINFPAMSNLTNTFDKTIGLWNQDKLYGASIGAYHVLARMRGYSIVYVVHMLDVFMVRNDLLRDNGAFAPPLETFREFGFSKGKGLHGPSSAIKQAMLMDYAVWQQTKSVTESQAAAREYLQSNPQYSHFHYAGNVASSSIISGRLAAVGSMLSDE